MFQSVVIYCLELNVKISHVIFDAYTQFNGSTAFADTVDYSGGELSAILG